MSETARKSVYQLDFENHLKEQWLGEYYKKGITHCDKNKTHALSYKLPCRAPCTGTYDGHSLCIRQGKHSTAYTDASVWAYLEWPV